MPWSVSTRNVTIGRLLLGFSAAPASGSSAGNSTRSVRVPVIFMADLGRLGTRVRTLVLGAGHGAFGEGLAVARDFARRGDPQRVAMSHDVAHGIAKGAQAMRP